MGTTCRDLGKKFLKMLDKNMVDVELTEAVPTAT